MKHIDAQTPTHPASRLSILAGLTLLALAGALFIWEMRTPIAQLDDAYISYRYAHNLVAGHGLVFNVGERVEGYTNLLWVLVVALGLEAGFPAPEFAHWMSVAAGLLLLWATYSYGASLLPRRSSFFAAAAPLALWSFNTFACWTSSGLEEGLFAALVVLALTATTRGRNWRSWAYCVVATLTRPEGALVAAVLLNPPWLRVVGQAVAGVVWRGVSIGPRWLERLRTAALPALAYGAFLLVLTLFRFVYYGDVLPNTFYAKVGGIPLEAGWRYLYNFLIDGPAYLFLGATVSAVLLPRFRTGCLLTAAVLVYVTLIGGDAFRLGRFFLPILPILVVGALAALPASFPRRKSLALVGALFVALACYTTLYIRIPARFGDGDFDYSRLPKDDFPRSVKRADAWIHDFFTTDAAVRNRIEKIRRVRPPVRQIAAVGIGKIGYYAPEFEILDLVGLTNKTIARSDVAATDKMLLLPGHQRSNAGFVFSQKPDLIDIPREGEAIPRLPAFVQLWNDDRLREEYSWDSEIGGYFRKPELRRRETSASDGPAR